MNIDYSSQVYDKQVKEEDEKRREKINCQATKRLQYSSTNETKHHLKTNHLCESSNVCRFQRTEAMWGFRTNANAKVQLAVNFHDQTFSEC